jgi:predicted amidohydrolase YtcJ
MDINTQAGMLERLAEAVKRVPKGLWITGGDWGELAARAALRKGEEDFAAFTPDLAAVDAVSPDHPVLFRRENGDYFANSLALKTLRINKFTPDPHGGSYVHDPESGELTGMLLRRAGDRAWRALPPKSRKHTLIAARALMQEFNSYGLTGIHDISRIDAISQRKIYRTNVERSYSDLGIYKDLRSEGDLSLRIYAILPLSQWDQLADFGVTPGGGDDWIRYGALKSFIDGSLMFEPFNDRPNYSGNFTFRVESPKQLHDNFLSADKLGFDNATHVIGDKAISMYLDWLEEAIRTNGPRDRRPRLIHMEYPRLEDIKRAGRLHAFAEMTPVHMLVEVDRIEKEVGAKRAQWAFAGRTLIDNGVRINLVSDLPGDYYKIRAKPIKPLVNIFMAVTRRYPSDPVSKSWHPQEGITIEEGLQAYTINPAWASHEEDVLGSVTSGKLADLVVLSKDVLSGTAEDLLDTQVLMTVLNGEVVYQNQSQ